MDNYDTKLFRRRAVERYRESRAESAPPRFAPPRVRLYVGVVCALLTTCALLMSATPAPVYLSVRAAAVAGQGRFGQPTDGLLLLVFIPPADAPSLKEGQRVYFKPNKQDRVMSGTLVAFESQAVSAAEVLSRYGLAGGKPLEINESVMVGVARIETPPSDATPVVEAGSVFDAKVEIGSKRLISLIPTQTREGSWEGAGMVGY